MTADSLPRHLHTEITNLREYEKTSFWMQKGEQIQQENRGKASENMFHIPENKEDVITYNLSTAQKLLHIFAGREDIFSIETIGYVGNRILFTEWIPVRYVNMFADAMEHKLANEKPDEISIEFFPNKTRIKAGKYGQVIKLPYGRHLRTGEQSYFIAQDGSPVTDLDDFLDNLTKNTLNAVKKVLAKNSGMKDNVQDKTVDDNLEVFGELEENVEEILGKCNLMRYLCMKAVKTGYLTHAERLSVLYVFGHLGAEGHEFVHMIMSRTLNYQYNVTDKFIQQIPAKPVSCIKLREQYKQITAEYGCNCTFKRSKNCYPSPVLHAIALSNHVNSEITLPTSVVTILYLA